eukprot:sb/3478332/
MLLHIIRTAHSSRSKEGASKNLGTGRVGSSDDKGKISLFEFIQSGARYNSTCSEFSSIPHISHLGFTALSLWFLDEARLFWPDRSKVICLIVDLFLKHSFP